MLCQTSQTSELAATQTKPAYPSGTLRERGLGVEIGKIAGAIARKGFAKYNKGLAALGFLTNAK